MLSGGDGGGSVTHPVPVTVEQPLAPAIVQLQIFTVCCGRLVVSALQLASVVVAQFLSLMATFRFCAPAGRAVKPAYQSLARAVIVAPDACVAAVVPSCPRATVQVVVPWPAVTCRTSLS